MPALVVFRSRVCWRNRRCNFSSVLSWRIPVKGFESKILSFPRIAVAIFVCTCCFYGGALSSQWWRSLGCPMYSNNILRRGILSVHVLNKGYRYATVNTKKLMGLVGKTEHQTLNKFFNHCCGTCPCPIWLNRTFRPW